MRAVRLGCVLCLCLPLGLSAATVDDVASESRRLTEFLDAEFDGYLALNPDMALSMGLDVHRGEITDRSEAYEMRTLDWRRDSVARMKATFDPARLDDVARAAYEIWDFELERHERRAKFPRHPYWLGGFAGAHTTYPRMFMTYQRVDGVDDVDDYVSRLTGIGRAIDQLRERVALAASEEIRMPRFEYTKTIQSCRTLLTGAPFTAGADSSLWADANKKIEALVDAGKATPQQASEALARVRTALLDGFAPAYRRAIGWFESDAVNAPVEHLGVASLPNGDAWYATALFLSTSEPLSAEEVHETGLREVAGIRAEMEAVKKTSGFEGSMKDFFRYLRTDSRFFLPNTDQGRAEYLRLAENYLDALKPRLPEYFGRLPKAELVVRRVEPFREEAGGAANYSPPSIDGSTPGIYYVHLLDMSALPLWQLEATAYHEGIPGHHLQLAIARELTGVPQLLTGGVGYSSFSEGWALYSEPLAKEMGFYRDPISDFGRLSHEQWRAVRLVVDTGLHTKDWSEDQAVRYFLEHVPMPEAAARSEVQRYLTFPGQAVSYKIGMMRIQRLRDAAKAALGTRFDYRRFHDVVLNTGAVPLPVLQARVQRWIAAGG